MNNSPENEQGGEPAFTTKNRFTQASLLRFFFGIEPKGEQLTETADASAKPKRVESVEFWRFFFTIMVCIYHLGIYIPLNPLMPSGSSAVEFFFILAGFTLAMSAKRKKADEVSLSTKDARAMAVDFVVKKLKAIYPILLIVMILQFLVIPAGKIAEKLIAFQQTEWEWLMLIGTPFGFNNGATPLVPLWFLTELLIVGYIFTFAIYKNYHLMTFSAPVLGVLGYILFTLNSSLILDFAIPMSIFNAGTVHAVSEMCFGISMFLIYDRLKRVDLSMFWRVILSLLEAYAIYRYCKLTFGTPVNMDNFRKLPYLMIIVLTSFLNVTVIARLLNNKLSALAAKISLPMYIGHWTMAGLYIGMVMQAKMMPGGSGAWLEKMGGLDGRFKMIPMSVMDVVTFLVIVIGFSALTALLVAAVKKMIEMSKDGKETI